MKNKKNLFLIFGIAIIFLASIILVSSATTACCEKTKTGAWCQNVQDDTECDAGFRMPPTSCDSTTYCQTGTCINVNRGTCTANTPKTICENGGGKWDVR